MRDFIKVMKALSDPNRVKLVKMLQKRTMCVCEVQAALGISQPTVSKHLKILEKAGLVVRKKEGLWVNYSLTHGESSPYAASLLGNLMYWLADDPDVRALIEKSRSVRREDICETHGCSTISSYSNIRDPDHSCGSRNRKTPQPGL